MDIITIASQDERPFRIKLTERQPRPITWCFQLRSRSVHVQTAQWPRLPFKRSSSFKQAGVDFCFYTGSMGNLPAAAVNCNRRWQCGHCSTMRLTEWKSSEVLQEKRHDVLLIDGGVKSEQTTKQPHSRCFCSFSLHSQGRLKTFSGWNQLQIWIFLHQNFSFWRRQMWNELLHWCVSNNQQCNVLCTTESERHLAPWARVQARWAPAAPLCPDSVCRVSWLMEPHCCCECSSPCSTTCTKARRHSGRRACSCIMHASPLLQKEKTTSLTFSWAEQENPSLFLQREKTSES